MMTTARSSPWPDIQPELLGLVLRRLPSLADHVRLRALCRPWRYNARVEPLPPTTYMDGEIHHMPLLDDASCHGSMDNWLFFVHNDDGCTLMNPFSKAALQLPNLTTTWHHEMNLTPDSLVVGLITDIIFLGTICICQPPLATDTVSNKDIKNIVDVAFFDGKLYVLNLHTHLYVMEIDKGHKDLTNRFMPEVPTDSCRKWRSVSTLGGQALFVGECSESLPAAECGVQEDCVYLISHYDESTPTVNPLHDSGVFNMRNGTITLLLPETVVVQTQGVRPSC
ncbi:hypothetical protein SETIT_4G032600v2 [Setaria italica]|uniref:KIB1-4 beta-propeller domain-containing protein n=1 Tax=Setaria italica TaxID=4555 RepID=A0A368QQP5_SETIT|nr:hypothetical protein SETIT_4G032600v2 [Setaria italica]